MNSLCSNKCTRCKLSKDNLGKYCHMCDQNYYLNNNGICKFSHNKNCQKLTLFDKCLQCKNGYFISNYLCVKIDEKKIISNCIQYNEDQKCILCEFLYEIDGNYCKKIKHKIPNCLYQQNQKCTQCKNQYYLSYDQTECISSIKNCRLMRRTKCKKCNKGYTNLYDHIENVFQSLNYHLEFNPFYFIIKEKNYPIFFGIGQCSKINIHNCLDINQNGNCIECEKGYFINIENNTCDKFPHPKIRNCLEYQIIESNNKITYNCSKCENQYHLYQEEDCFTYDGLEICNQQICKKVDIIPGCFYYKQDVFNTVCLACLDIFYLIDGKCEQLRQKLIYGCEVYHPFEDQCNKCQENHILNTEKTFCDQKIKNCKLQDIEQHQSLDMYNDFISGNCITCEGGYMLNKEKFCVKTIKQCWNYKNMDECNRCEYQYYPTPYCLSKHQNIENCEIYSQTTKNKCLKCKQSFIPIQIKSQCKKFWPIDNCQNYVENNFKKCKECKAGYELVDDSTKCSKISDILNCLEKKNSLCTQCEDNYILYNQQCIENFVYQSDDFCLKKENGICQTCQEGHFMQNEFYCKSWDSYKLEKRINNFDQRIKFMKNVIKIKDFKKQTTDYINWQYYTGDEELLILINCKTGYLKIENYLDFYTMKGDCVQKCNGKIITKGIHYENICFELQEIELQILFGQNKFQSGQYYFIEINSDKLYNIVQYICDPQSLILYPNDYKTIILNQYYLQQSEDILEKFVINHIADFNIIKDCKSQTNLTYPLQLNDSFIYKARELNNYGTQQSLWFKIQTEGEEGESASGIFIRIRCPWQQIGIIQSFSGTRQGHNQKYLECEENEDEFQRDRLYNLHEYWQLFFTTHMCKAITKIPMLVLNLKYNETLKNILFDRYDNYSLENGTNAYPKNQLCIDISTQEKFIQNLGLDQNSLENYQINLMENCGLLILNLDKYNTETFDNTNYSKLISETYDDSPLLCAACKPGYKTVDRSVYNEKKIAYQCTIIENCSNKNQILFNGCGQCEKGYAWYQDDQIKDTIKNIYFDRCVKLPENLENCQVLYENEIQKTCSLCKKGYYRNLNGYCDLIEIQQCQENLNENYLSLISENQYQYRQGCDICKSGYILHDEKSDLCLKSQYLKDNKLISKINYTQFDQFLDQSSFIQGCKNYTFKNLCEQCYDEYISSIDKFVCIQKNQENKQCLQYEIVNDQSQCGKCQSTHYLKEGQCHKGTIQKCIEFKYTLQEECLQCQNYYGLTENKQNCIKGTVDNCLIYTNSNECKQCQEGYQLLNNINCIIQPKNILCNEQKFIIKTEENFNYIQEQCQKCENDQYYIIDLEESQVLCQEIISIKNCLIYNTDIDTSKILNEQFICIECIEGYFFNFKEKQCQIRKNIVKNCEQYYLLEDLCEKCKPNYSNNLKDKKCIAYPTGISGCIQYIKQNECYQCNKYQYLTQDKQCEKVENIIENCLYYYNEDRCLKCKNGFYLKSPTNCVEIYHFLNCQNYISENSCLSCPMNYELVQGVNNICVPIQLPPYCKQVDVYTHLCILCEDGYQLNIDNCVQSNQIIKNCEVMIEQNFCHRCLPGYALSLDQKSCLENTDLENDCYGYMLEEPECILCINGYELINGECVENSSIFREGCYYMNSEGKCQVCIENYKMNYDDQCRKS